MSECTGKCVHDAKRIYVLKKEIERLRGQLAEAKRLLKELAVWGQDFDGSWRVLDEIDAFLAAEDKPKEKAP
jgi:hypothetical protein